VNAPADEETDEASRRCIMHIGLHYILLIGCQVDEEVRELRTKISPGTTFSLL